jgi:2-desacetyl-2-hydroxyethyl bacteriochlorophyllide A dehydrogenase
LKTEGLWYLGERKVEVRAMEIPQPGPDDVVVEMEACGICTWDVVSFLGRFGRYQKYPFCAGHEGVGRIVRAGERVKSVKSGQRVAMHELPVGTAGGPLMARHALRAEQQVAVIPENDLAVRFWIVEPAACVVNGILFAGIQPGDRVAVVGTGYMGLLFVQGLRRSLLGNLTVFDVDSKRLALASELGADTAVSLARDAIPQEFARSFDVVIETAATPESLNAALALVRSGGIIVNFAWHHHEHAFDLEDWHVHGWRILNIQPEMNPHFGDLYPRTIALMANGTISNQRLVTHAGPFERAAEIYEAAADRTGGYIKGVITF